MRLVSGILAVFLVFVATFTAHAQSTTGSILGDIVDASGAALPGVTVNVTHTTTGATREVLTNAVGAYRVTGLQPAEYQIAVQLDGFRSATRTGVVLPIQGEIKIDFTMEVGQVTESITVTGEAPLVRPTANSIQTVVDNFRVEGLPLKNRDFMDLALLAPGVVLDQSSIRSGATDSISFFGMDEPHKAIWLDGVDFNDEVVGGGTNISGATRTRLGQEAIQEFQVMSTGYSPEFGRSGSGAINVVLKSGGNDIHGSAFYFIRDDAFDKPAFGLRGGVPFQDGDVPEFRTEQYGGTVGGPIARNRAFYFFSFERKTNTGSSQITIPDSVKTFVDSLNLGYDTRSSVSQDRKQYNAIGKFTFNLNEDNSLHLTYLYDDDNDLNKDIGGEDAADRGFDDLNNSYFATANWTSLIGANTVNELRINRSSQRLFRSIREDSLFLPSLIFPAVNIGLDGSATPQGRNQKNWIIANTTTYQWGDHTLKWGGEMNDIVATNDTNEDFNGSFVFETDTAPFLPVEYSSGFNLQFARGDSSDPTLTQVDRDMDMYGLFVNDTWRLTPTLTLNMGLRYDLRVLEGDLGGPDPFEQPGFSRDKPEDVWLNVALGPSGTLGLQPWRPTPTDTLDVSPRLGFAWDVLGTGRAVIRGSYGLFHDRVPTLTHRGIVNSYNGLNIQTVREQDPIVVQSFFPNPPAGDALPAGSTTVPSPSGDTPYTQHTSAGFQYEISPNMAVSADFTHILGLNFLMSRNVNAPLPNGECPFDAALIANGLTNSLCSFRMTMGHDQSGRIHVNSLSLRLDRSFSSGFGFLLGYTVGSAKEFNRGGFPVLIGVAPSDPNDKFGDIHFGPTENDVRHRLTGNLIYELPYDINVSTIVTANSAAPYDQTTGRDNNGDGFRNDRSPGVGVHSERGDNFFNTDLRLSKRFFIDETKNVEVLWEMFNMFNTANLLRFNGNESSVSFGQARSVLRPFQAQLGLKFTF